MLLKSSWRRHAILICDAYAILTISTPKTRAHMSSLYKWWSLQFVEAFFLPLSCFTYQLNSPAIDTASQNIDYSYIATWKDKHAGKCALRCGAHQSEEDVRDKVASGALRNKEFNSMSTLNIYIYICFNLAFSLSVSLLIITKIPKFNSVYYWLTC